MSAFFRISRQAFKRCCRMPRLCSSPKLESSASGSPFGLTPTYSAFTRPSYVLTMSDVIRCQTWIRFISRLTFNTITLTIYVSGDLKRLMPFYFFSPKSNSIEMYMILFYLPFLSRALSSLRNNWALRRAVGMELERN